MLEDRERSGRLGHVISELQELGREDPNRRFSSEELVGLVREALPHPQGRYSELSPWQGDPNPVAEELRQHLDLDQETAVELADGRHAPAKTFTAADAAEALSKAHDHLPVEDMWKGASSGPVTPGVDKGAEPVGPKEPVIAMGGGASLPAPAAAPAPAGDDAAATERSRTTPNVPFR